MTTTRGIDIVEVESGVRPISVSGSRVIGLVGSSDDAVADSWPLNNQFFGG